MLDAFDIKPKIHNISDSCFFANSYITDVKIPAGGVFNAFVIICRAIMTISWVVARIHHSLCQRI